MRESKGVCSTCAFQISGCPYMKYNPNGKCNEWKSWESKDHNNCGSSCCRICEEIEKQWKERKNDK